jgi:hypothetical protein
MIDLEKIKKREQQKHKQGYYSKESVWFRHQQDVKNDKERAKNQNNPRIASSCLNNDWD